MKSIARDGTADRDGRLQPNDVIMAVDGHSLSGVPCETVIFLKFAIQEHSFLEKDLK